MAQTSRRTAISTSKNHKIIIPKDILEKLDSLESKIEAPKSWIILAVKKYHKVKSRASICKTLNISEWVYDKIVKGKYDKQI